MDSYMTSADPAFPRHQLQAVQEAIRLLLGLLTPLWVNSWGQQPFELSKVALARTLIWLLAGLAVAEAILSGPTLSGTRLRHLLLGPVAVLGLVVIAATVSATNPGLSLWGSAERVQGAVTLLTYLSLFLVAACCKPWCRPRCPSCFSAFLGRWARTPSAWSPMRAPRSMPRWGGPTSSPPTWR